MKPGNHSRIPTVSAVVGEAAAIVDPAGDDDAVVAMVEIYEDDDRPATVPEDLIGDLVATAEGIDPEGDDGPVLACAAVGGWLATNQDQAHGADHEYSHVLREGVRLAFRGETPKQVVAFLDSRGVTI